MFVIDFACQGEGLSAPAAVRSPGRLSERSCWLARHVLPHEPMLRAWLRRRLIEGLETDDVVQETYVILSGLSSVTHIASPRAYAFQIARSVIGRHLRRARMVRFEPFGEVVISGLPSDTPSPEQQASSRQELRRVANLVAALPPKCRQALVLSKFDGLSQRDVARRMSISEKTVENHVGRARLALFRGLPGRRAEHLTF